MELSHIWLRNLHADFDRLATNLTENKKFKGQSKGSQRAIAGCFERLHMITKVADDNGLEVVIDTSLN